MILADTARHLAEAIAAQPGSADGAHQLQEIVGHFLTEVGRPGGPASGPAGGAP
ncbi:hypothetical protein D3C72_2046760 [compost metagenome]